MNRPRTVIIAVILTVVIILCGIYAAKIFLPARMNGYIAGFLAKNTGYRVAIGSIGYVPPARFRLKDIVFYNSKTNQRTAVNIENVSFTLKLGQFLKGKNVIASIGLGNLRYAGMRLNGFALLELKDLSSPARRPFLENADGTITLKNFSLSAGASSVGIDNINGAIVLQDNTVKLVDASFCYKNSVFDVGGILTELDLDEPEGNFSIKSDLLTAAGNFVVKDEYIKIKKMSVRFLSSSYNIMGDIRNVPFGSVNLYCEAKVNLEDMREMFSTYLPGRRHISDTLKPAGRCAVAAFYSGDIKNPAVSESSIKLSSGKLYLRGIGIDNVYLDMRMHEGIITTHRFSMEPYHGLFDGSFSMDMTKKGNPFSVTFSLKDADLHMLSADTALKGKEISGLLSSKLFLKGLADSAKSLRGSGWITVTDGQLWEIPILGGVTNILGMPNLRTVVFKEAAGNFVIDRKMVSTDDLTLYSNSMNITARGFVDFDQNIDLLLNTNITQNIVSGSSDAANVANLLITQAGNYMGKIRIRGTLKKPKYSISTKPIEDAFKKEIKGLLQNILQ